MRKLQLEVTVLKSLVGEIKNSGEGLGSRRAVEYKISELHKKKSLENNRCDSNMQNQESASRMPPTTTTKKKNSWKQMRKI